MMTSDVLNLAPLPGMQTEACQSPATELMLGGQAGPGKSWFLLFEDIHDAIRYPELRTVILRDTSPQLADLIEKAHAMYSPLGARFTSMHTYYKKSVFEWPIFDYEEDDDGNLLWCSPRPGTEKQGAKFILGHCQHENDKFNYSGFEYQRLKFDELTNFSESTYLFLFSRVRTTNPKIRTTIRATTNPVGKGMLWVRRRFVEVLPPRELGWFLRKDGKDMRVPRGTPLAMSRQWIPGDRSQNTYLDHSQYDVNLQQLPERMRIALALGSWDIPEEDDQVIKPAWVDRAFRGETVIITNPRLATRGAMGVDPAGKGGDLAVICSGKGNRPLWMKGWKTTTSIDLAYLVTKAKKEYGASQIPIGIDANGLGSGVAEILDSGGKGLRITELWGLKGMEVDIPRLGASVYAVTEKDENFESRYRGHRKFGNIRAQMWWKLREDMSAGNVDLSLLCDPQSSEDITSLLHEELLAVRYHERGGILYVTSKDDLRKADSLGRSPDYADALVLWNWVRDREVEANHEDFIEEFMVDSYMRKLGEAFIVGEDDDETTLTSATFF